MADELPPIVTRLVGDLSGLHDTLATGKAEVAAWREEVSSGGRDAGQRLGKDFGDGIQDAIPAAFGGPRGTSSFGQKIGAGIGAGLGQGLSDSAPLIEDEVDKKVKEPLQTKGSESGAAFSAAFTDALRDTITPSRVAPDALIGDVGKKGAGAGDEFAISFSRSARDGLAVSPLTSLLAPDGPVGEQIVKDSEKTGDKAGKDAGNAASAGMSPLLTAAFTTAAVVGPAALLAGTSVAVAGVGALVAKSNANIKAGYATLATDVSNTLTTAVQPLVPAIQTAMTQADTAISGLGPVLHQTFADAAPDITSFTGGVTGLAASALPGLDTAINQSRGIVSGFAGSLPTLGSGVGSFFTGLTTNAQSTERGIVDFVQVASNALGTLGHVAGSASAALSTDFAAVTPVLDGALGAINKIANPATVGGIVGAFGAMKLDPAISSGLSKASDGMLSVAGNAEKAFGPTSKLAGAAVSSASGFAKAADVMSGPWGIAIGAGIGLVGGLVSSLSQSVATVSDFTAAVAQDNGVVGASTSAIIQKKLATLDLGSVQQDLGVSESTLIEYAAGDAQAQDQVRAAYTQKMDALDKSTKLSQQNTNVTEDGTIAAKRQATELQNVMGQVEQVTDAVAGAVKAQDDQNRAYLAATKSSNIFAAMVDTSTTALQTNANQAGINTVAALQLGDAQDGVTQHLANQISAFQLATQQTSAFKTVLDATFGRYQDLSQAQATFTTDLDNASKSLTKGKNAIDLNTVAGAANFTVLSGLASQNEAVAESVLKQTGNQDQANKALQDGATKIDALAKSAGFTDTQIAALNKDLYGTASIKDINVTVGVNTAPAYQGVNELVNFINSSGGTVHVYEAPGGSVHNTGMSGYAFAEGGFVDAAPGQPVPATVHGREYVLSRDMLAGRQAVDPQVLAALRGYTGAGAPGSSGGVALAPPPVAAGTPVIVNTFYIDGSQVTGAVRSSAQRYARRNSSTGLT